MRIDQLKFLARLLLWGGLALLLTLRYFDVNPITLKGDDPVEFKVEQPRRASGEVLVVVDGAGHNAPSTHPEAFAAMVRQGLALVRASS